MTILVFLLILSILVIIHEAGHYFVAKKLGIKVEEFGFGFPPKVWGKKIGETVYSINLLPIGGFVKLYGEDEAGAGRVDLEDPRKKVKSQVHRAFFSRPVWQRAAVVIAGVVMNTLLAAAVYYTFLGFSNFKTHLPLLSDHRFLFVNQTNYNTKSGDLVVSEVVRNTPAEMAGIKPPVKITSVNGQKIKDQKVFSELVNNNKGKKLTLGLQDVQTDRAYNVNVTPRVNPPKGEGAMGIAFYPVAILDYATPTQRFLSGFTHPINLMRYNMEILGKLVGISFQERTVEPVGNAVAGPIGIYKLFELYSVPDLKERLLNYLNLAGMLSISLAFFNVLPIPALDGGRLFFILIEGIFRKKVNQRFETIAHTVGMAILLTLIVLITFKDIFQFILSPLK